MSEPTEKKQFDKKYLRLWIKLFSLGLILILGRGIIFHIRSEELIGADNPLAMFDLMGKVLMLSGFFIGLKWHGVGGWLILGGFAMLEIIPGPVIGEQYMLVKYIYPVWGIIYIVFWISDTIAAMKK